MCIEIASGSQGVKNELYFNWIQQFAQTLDPPDSGIETSDGLGVNDGMFTHLVSII